MLTTNLGVSGKPLITFMYTLIINWLVIAKELPEAPMSELKNHYDHVRRHEIQDTVKDI